MVKVVDVVRWSIEVLSNPGVSAAWFSDAPRGGVGGGADLFQRRRDAQAVIEAVIQLPAEQNLALMCQVHAQDIRRLPDYLADLVSFAGHFVGERGLRFGVEGLVYWVRHWVRADGSFREFGARFGVDHKTAAKFYREVFEPVLDGWLTAAVGTMEPVALAAWPAEEELAA